MPSPFGHALGGVAAAWSAERLPPGKGLTAARISGRLTIICAVLGAAADLDLLVPGTHRTVTHSITAAVFVTIVAAAVTRWVTPRFDWRVAAICGAAYASHLVLDWLGHDPYPPFGIELLWPFSHRSFISDVGIFRGTQRDQPFAWDTIVINVKAAAQEIAILGPLVLLLAWTRDRSGGARGSGRAGGVGGSGRNGERRSQSG